MSRLGLSSLLLASGCQAETWGSCFKVVERREGCSGVVLLLSPGSVLHVTWCLKPDFTISFCLEMSNWLYSVKSEHVAFSGFLKLLQSPPTM